MRSANLAAAFQVLETLPPSHELERAQTRLHIAATQVQRLRKDYSSLRAHPATPTSRHVTAQVMMRSTNRISEPTSTTTEISGTLSTAAMTISNGHPDLHHKHPPSSTTTLAATSTTSPPSQTDFKVSHSMFKPVGIDNFDGDSNPMTCLTTSWRPTSP
jgi:hypothetical protein